jgi:hypothetical protein
MPSKTFQLRDMKAGRGYQMDEGALDADSYFHGAGLLGGGGA